MTLIAYCAEGIEALRGQVRTLGDSEFLRNPASQIFAVAQAHRLLGDQVARYLSAIPFQPGDFAAGNSSSGSAGEERTVERNGE